MTPTGFLHTETSPAQLLDFERQWPRHSGRKESAIISELQLDPARYYVLLKRAAESLEGQAHDGLTAHRVLRLSRQVRAGGTSVPA
ncbi:DUF3263 domain-containing protein [Microbacterium lacus]|uniref:DUF3263 domain-containing protein n=1 Tax=Microbacterium lacus TaxID=415217 RepID=UPI0018E257C7|nr:DUF3263 domain-containing protein [Microbacterium lacus]